MHCLRFLGAALLALLLAPQSRGQHAFIDSVLRHHSLPIPEYQVSAQANDTLLLQMPYAQSGFIDTSRLHLLRGAQILSVDLLFTDYPAYDDLLALNRARLLSLAAAIPQALEQPNVQWQVLRQMKGNTRESAQRMLHGFIINYRRKPTARDTEKELNRVHRFVDHEKEKREARKKPARPVNHWEIIHRNRRQTTTTYLGRLVKKMSEWPDTLLREKRTGDSLVALTVRQATERRILTPVYAEGKKPGDTLYLLLAKIPEALPPAEKESRTRPDSGVIKTLQKIPASGRTAVIADVTGSMSPWLVQLLEFLAQSEDKGHYRHITVFNDGDQTPDVQKQPGRTGGIYAEPYRSALEAADLMALAIQKGRGGDLQENTLEAVLSAQESCNDCDNLLLLADGWAPVRDLALASQIRKPLTLVLCGNRLGVHPHYLKLALLTGARIFLPHGTEIMYETLKTGKPVQINYKTYQLVNGEVREIQ